jgi:hypothetical protein
VQLTTYGASLTARAAVTTPVFDDAGTPRIGFAFVRDDVGTADYLTVAKINPAGTNKATYVDDAKFDTVPGGGYELSSGANASDIDRVDIDWTSESSVGRFYVAYRQDTDIKVVKIRSTWSASVGYDAILGTLSSGAFTDTGTSDAQDLRMSLGSKSSSTVVGVVYKKLSTDHKCYFRRLNEALTVASQELTLTSQRCYRPSIHYNSKTGRFVVTMGVRTNGTNYDIVTTEITLGSDPAGLDTFPTPTVIVATGATALPTKLETAFYPAGNWMAVFYKLNGGTDMKIHGYHVPSI